MSVNPWSPGPFAFCLFLSMFLHGGWGWLVSGGPCAASIVTITKVLCHLATCLHPTSSVKYKMEGLDVALCQKFNLCSPEL